MLSTEYYIVHQIPGRIRIRIPQILKDTLLASKLQQSMEAVKGIKALRINAVANCLVIEFKEKTLSQIALEEQLEIAIRQIRESSLKTPATSVTEVPTETNQVEVREKTVTQTTLMTITIEETRESSLDTETTPQTELANSDLTENQAKELNQVEEVKTKVTIEIIVEENLTHYEQEQTQHIRHWASSNKPNLLASTIDSLFSGFNIITNFIIPGGIIEQALTACDKIASEWHQDWKNLKSEAKVEIHTELRQVNLEFCDHLAERVKNEAVVLAGVEGTISGMFEFIGELTEIPLTIILALKTIHKIGLCYGYAPETEEEKYFAWTIVAVTTAISPEEKEQAFAAFFHFQKHLYLQVLDNLFKEELEDISLDNLRETILRQTIRYLTEEFSGEAIPFAGIVIGGLLNSRFIAEVGESAKLAFQIRWLQSNNKLRIERKSVMESQPVDISPQPPISNKPKTRQRKQQKSAAPRRPTRKRNPKENGAAN